MNRFLVPYRILLFGLMVAAILISHLGLSQIHVVNKGVDITNVNVKITLPGNLENRLDSLTKTKSGSIANADTIFLSGDLINNANNQLFSTSAGVLAFNGAIHQFIKGDTSVLFHNVLLNKPGGWLRITRNTDIGSSFVFTRGKLFLDSFNLDLGATGNLVNENDTAYAFSQNGFIVSRRFISNPTIAQDIGGMGLFLQSNSNFSFTDIKRGHTQQNGAGNGSIYKYFEFLPTNNNAIDSIVLRYYNSDVGGAQNEHEFTYWQSDNTGIVWANKKGSVDTSNNLVFAGSQLLKQSLLSISEGDCDFPPIINLPDSVERCLGDTASFDANLPGHFYQWSTNDTTQKITVASAGTYTVTVTSVKGCVSIDTTRLVYRPFPLASFSASQVCESDSTVFTNSSYVSGGGVLNHFWDFGDTTTSADTSSLQNPSYVYPYSGQKSIRLIVSTSYGCADTATTITLVYPIPQANFGFNNACEDSLVQFTDSATVGGGFNIFTREYKFGDGDSSTAANPSHVYDSSDIYTVKYIVQSNAGCWDSVSKPVSIFPNPKAAFTISNACESTASTILNSSSIASGNLTYQWNFGDNTNDTAQSPQKIYSAPGTYTVQLSVSSIAGCKHDTSASVTIYDNPVAAFSANNVCQSDTVSFTNSSTVTNGTLSYSWNFGDNTTSTQSNPRKNYASARSFSVKLVAESSFGCKDSITRNVTTFPEPIANFNNNRVCQGDTSTFFNLSTVSSGSLNSNWTFGDGNSSTLSNPSHVYANRGTYNTKLVVSTGNQCKDSTTKITRVDSLPIVNLGSNVVTCGSSFTLDAQNPGASYVWSTLAKTRQINATFNGTYAVTVTTNRGCYASDTIQLTLNSTPTTNIGPDTTVCGSYTLNAFSNGASYVWSNGLTNASITTDSSSTYWVRVTDQNNCVSSDTARVTIDTLPKVNLGSDIIACQGENRTLTANLSNVKYLWNTGDTTVSIGVSKSGNYWLQITDANQCKGRDTLKATFNPTPVVNLGIDSSYCDSTLLDAKNIGANYLWNNGKTTQTLSVSASANYWVRVTNTFNCAASDTVSITINASPVFSLGNDSTFCSNDSLVVRSPQKGLKYKWNTGATTDSILVNSTSKVWLQLTDSNKCIGSDTVNYTFNPAPQINLGKEQFLCLGDSAILLAGDSSRNYTWGFNDSTLIDSSFSLVAADSGKYWVRVTDSIGCSASDTVVIHKTSLQIHARFLMASEIEAGDTVQFINLSYPSPLKYKWNFGDGSTSTDSMPTNAYYIDTTFTISLHVSNDFCSDSLSKVLRVKKKPKKEIQQPNQFGSSKYVSLINAKIYPNPTRFGSTYEIELDESARVEVRMYNLQGVLFEMRVLSGKHITQTLNTTHLATGIYLFQIRVGDDYKTLKLVKI